MRWQREHEPRLVFCALDCLEYQNPSNHLTLHPKIPSWPKCFGRYPVDIPSQRPSLCRRRYLDTMSRTARKLVAYASNG